MINKNVDKVTPLSNPQDGLGVGGTAANNPSGLFLPFGMWLIMRRIVLVKKPRFFR